MSIEPGTHCGHVCCDEPHNPFHDHFLTPTACRQCKRRRVQMEELRQRAKELSDQIDAGGES